MFATLELKLKKPVQRGDRASLLSLFGPAERFRRAPLLHDGSEGATVRLTVGDLARVDLRLGADMRAGAGKCLMTLFWYEERARDFELLRDAQGGETIKVEMVLA